MACQIITSDGEFRAGDDSFQSIETAISGKELISVAILGAQSSGKSTLLNELFGTAFAVHGPGAPSTKGVALSAVPMDDTHDLIVLDVEGSDSRERGDGAKVFAKKTGLFALQLCDVVIVNMWFHDVGRSDGNASLVRGLFEEGLKLAAASENPAKTHILFIVRDQDEQVSDDDLRSAVLGEVQQLYAEAPKPSKLVAAPMSSFFDFSVYGLPHLRYARAQFSQKISALRDRFMLNTGDCFFSPEISKHVPSADFFQFAGQSWDAISRQSIEAGPNASDLQAAYKCDQVYADLFQQFTAAVKPWKTLTDQKLMDNFGKRGHELIQAYLEKYDREMEPFRALAVCSKKRADFQKAMLSDLHSIFVKLMPRIRQMALARFRSSLSSPFQDLDDFLDAAEREAKTQELFFLQKANACVVPTAPWSYANERMELQALIQEFAEEKKAAIVQIQKANAQLSQSESRQPKMTNFNFSFGFNFQFGPGGY
eukprot:tig00021464_g21759.t1